jgi:hypothetical protein
MIARWWQAAHDDAQAYNVRAQLRLRVSAAILDGADRHVR